MGPLLNMTSSEKPKLANFNEGPRDTIRAGEICAYRFITF